MPRRRSPFPRLFSSPPSCSQFVFILLTPVCFFLDPRPLLLLIHIKERARVSHHTAPAAPTVHRLLFVTHDRFCELCGWFITSLFVNLCTHHPKTHHQQSPSPNQKEGEREDHQQSPAFLPSRR